jgi:DNA-binding transcriptional MerR regulator
MRISELAAATGVPVSTLKMYIRDGLLPRGKPTSRTQAIYDDSHIIRLQLVRTLQISYSLPLTRIRQVVATLEARSSDDPFDVATEALASLSPVGNGTANEMRGSLSRMLPGGGISRPRLSSSSVSTFAADWGSATRVGSRDKCSAVADIVARVLADLFVDVELPRSPTEILLQLLHCEQHVVALTRAALIGARWGRGSEASLSSVCDVGAGVGRVASPH